MTRTGDIGVTYHIPLVTCEDCRETELYNGLVIERELSDMNDLEFINMLLQTEFSTTEQRTGQR